MVSCDVLHDAERESFYFQKTEKLNYFCNNNCLVRFYTSKSIYFSNLGRGKSFKRKVKVSFKLVFYCQVLYVSVLEFDTLKIYILLTLESFK